MDEPTEHMKQDPGAWPEGTDERTGQPSGSGSWAERQSASERTPACKPAPSDEPGSSGALESDDEPAPADQLDELIPDELIPADSELQDLEEAYRRALAANEAAESLLELSGSASSDGPAERRDTADAAGQSQPEGPALSHALAQTGSPAQTGDADDEPARPPLELKRVVEAVLFVGAEKLTTKRLCRVLGEEVRTQQVVEAIDELNAQYARENRPYEIRLEEGGYRMVLRPEYEKVRNRVYGLGPREVRLPQEALDVLALVAYYQPISRAEIEEKGNLKASGILRQLLRRELVSIQRDERNPKNVRYTTTPRFLSLFGLSSLDELPQLEDFEIK